ncbi:hypothetical protein [Escherichia coli]|uniref:hypothetical protein n=1 Tax=Escherichia coli TaxID=562 RepID=UPI00226FFC83|nr:hypothetical protein [Escherichia coli]
MDLPFYQQYWRYLQGLLHGDLGRSFIQRSEVSELVSARIGPSLQLMAAVFSASWYWGSHSAPWRR